MIREFIRERRGARKLRHALSYLREQRSEEAFKGTVLSIDYSYERWHDLRTAVTLLQNVLWRFF